MYLLNKGNFFYP